MIYLHLVVIDFLKLSTDCGGPKSVGCRNDIYLAEEGVSFNQFRA